MDAFLKSSRYVLLVFNKGIISLNSVFNSYASFRGILENKEAEENVILIF